MPLPSSPPAAAQRPTLLDLPACLLIELLSFKHCSADTACSAAGTCYDLRPTRCYHLAR